MNSNAYPSQSPSSPSAPSSQPTIDPSMLAAFQNSHTPSSSKFSNYQQLMSLDPASAGMNPIGIGTQINIPNMPGLSASNFGGPSPMGPMSNPSHMPMNPAQLMQQQNMLAMNGATGMDPMSAMGNMNGMGHMNGMPGMPNLSAMGNMSANMAAMSGMGINPAALAGMNMSPAALMAANSNPNNMNMNMNMNNMAVGISSLASTTPMPGSLAMNMNSINPMNNMPNMPNSMNMNGMQTPHSNPNMGAPSSHPQPSSSMNHPSGPSNHPQQSHNVTGGLSSAAVSATLQLMLNQMGISRAQFQSMPPGDRQAIQQKVIAYAQQHQARLQAQHQQQQQQHQQQLMQSHGHGHSQGHGHGHGHGHAQQQQQQQHGQQHHQQGMMPPPMPDGGASLHMGMDPAMRPRSTSIGGGAGGTPFYERPRSSASHHSGSSQSQSHHAQAHVQQQHMMPPPPIPRPSTAQGQQQQQQQQQQQHGSVGQGSHPQTPTGQSQQLQLQQQQHQQQGQQLSRPGTALSHHSHHSPKGGAASAARPPSRAMSVGEQQTQAQAQGQAAGGQGQGQFVLNGYPAAKPGTPAPQTPGTNTTQNGMPGGGANPYPSASAGSPQPGGSPSRGAKRKLGSVGSPSMGVGGGLPMLQNQNQGQNQGQGLTMQQQQQQHMQAQAQHAHAQGQHGQGQHGQGQGQGMRQSTPTMSAMMGPPGLPRQQSEPQMNGAGGGAPPGTPRPRSSMGPGAGMGHMGMNMNMGMPMGGMGNGGPDLGMPDGGPRTPQRQTSMPPHGLQTPQPQQQHGLQRQMSVPPVPGTPLQASPIKAGSLPPVSQVHTPAQPQSQSQPQAQSQSQPQPQTQAVVPALPPLPAGVTLNPAITQVTIVPLAGSDTTIPPLAPEDIAAVQAWMAVDRGYEAGFFAMKERMTREVREVLGPERAPWWEMGALGVDANRMRRGPERFQIVYPRSRRDRERGRGKLKREGVRLPRRIKPEDADQAEELVPIRLEFDVEHHKMRDTFIWNLNDPVVTPEHFAQTLVDDYQLGSSYHSVIVKAIQDQLSDFRAHHARYDPDGGELLEQEGDVPAQPRCGALDDEDAAWWEAWRKRLRTERGFVRAARRAGVGRRAKRKGVKSEEGVVERNKERGGEKENGVDKDKGKDEPVPAHTIPIDEGALHEELRILIKLDIIVGSMKLDDQLEWDLDNSDASPEEFAAVYVKELGLGGEFKTAIAHAIREQIQTYQKSLFLVGHPSDGSAVQDDDLRMSFLPTLASGARAIDQVVPFTPQLAYLSDGEIEKNEKDRDKDMNRRRKRNTRGRRGIALPDREPIRTYRTPAIGFPELDPATVALAAAANAPVSRRAAAAAASLTIASMVASENGTPFVPHSMPSVPQPAPAPAAPKEKKVKGFFKAPVYPPTVLRPRAQIAAPTPSTAADVTKLPAPLENDPPSDPPPPPPVIPPTPDSKAAKVITAKRAKELEREAKEKEFADGQRPNFIDGVWHCSNCGCPESIAVGRRKGPLGDKSQCGNCGKFWHRHRRPRPVEYNSDPSHHMRIKKEAEMAKTVAKKKGGAAALRAQSAAAATPIDGAGSVEPQTPARSSKAEVEATSQQSPVAEPTEDASRAMSPVSTASSASEPPLAQRVKVNGAGSHSAQAAPASSASATPAPSSARPVSQGASQQQPQTVSPTNSNQPKNWPPQWLQGAMQAMQAKYSNDRFEVILRKVTQSTTPEWRIKCLDCPGKLYTPGPGETLANYEVHLKNRQHRQRVNERLSGSTGAA